MCRMYGISIENNLKNEIVRMCFEMMDGRIRVKGDDYEI